MGSAIITGVELMFWHLQQSTAPRVEGEVTWIKPTTPAGHSELHTTGCARHAWAREACVAGQPGGSAQGMPWAVRGGRALSSLSHPQTDRWPCAHLALGKDESPAGTCCLRAAFGTSSAGQQTCGRHNFQLAVHGAKPSGALQAPRRQRKTRARQ